MCLLNTIKSIVAFLVLVVLGTGSVFSQQVATNIIDNVDVAESGFNAIAKIEFKRPIRYISHSPASSAEVLHIRVDVLNALSNKSTSLYRSESIVPHKSTAIKEVVFENSGINSNYIIIYFAKEVSYEVVQGSELRNLSIMLYGLN